VNPASGVEQNFFTAEGVTYTVTAEDGTAKTYTARATRTPYTEKGIVSFTVDGTAWAVNGSDITYVYPAGTVETLLTPVITLSPGATVNPPSGASQNFFTEQGVTYTVTAEDGTTQTYTVKATIQVQISEQNWVVVPRYGIDDGWAGFNYTAESGEPYSVEERDSHPWSLGHPMLIFEYGDRLGNGWSMPEWFEPGRYPYILIIDMKESRPVSEVSGVGGYLNDVELYLTDELPIPGYETHTVNWSASKEDREASYSTWVEAMIELIPDGLPLSSWGEPIARAHAEGTIGVNGENREGFSLVPSEPSSGRYLIVLFPHNSWYDTVNLWINSLDIE
jgi:hypothetical protein